MRVIYMITNKINGKKYIGQTNNFQVRMNGHKSDAFNPNSHSYNYPLSNAIRKYGWENFDNRIIEEIHDEEDYQYVDERGRFFIQYYNSLTTQNGYNITTGGAGCPKPKLTFEQKVSLSKLFTLEQVIDIQTRIQTGEKRITIMQDYPYLTNSLFDNINAGLNFGNENLTYPLYDYKKDLSKHFTQDEIHQIKDDIIQGNKYKDIAQKWDLAISMISLINNGKQWFEKEYNYPLCYCKNNRTHTANTWVKDVQQDLISSSLKMTEIAEKYNKAYSTIKKINSGASHKNLNYKYPLTSNRT